MRGQRNGGARGRQWMKRRRDTAECVSDRNTVGQVFDLPWPARTPTERVEDPPYFDFFSPPKIPLSAPPISLAASRVALPVVPPPLVIASVAAATTVAVTLRI